MAEDHELTVHIEVPVKVYFSTHPAEARTATYPGCDAHLQVEYCELQIDSNIDIGEYIQEKHSDYIHQKCVDAVERGEK